MGNYSESKTEKDYLPLAWPDLANAYGSVSHQLLYRPSRYFTSQRNHGHVFKKKCISRASRYASQPWCSWLGGSTSRWVQRWGAVKIFWYTMVPWAEKKSLGTTDLRFETINIPLSIGYHSRRIHSLPENANSTLNIANSAISSNLSYQRRPLKWPTAENLSQARCDTQDRLLGFPKRNKIRGFSSGDWAHNCNIRNISLVAHSQTPSC